MSKRKKENPLISSYIFYIELLYKPPRKRNVVDRPLKIRKLDPTLC
jgi:hypothetical protein